VFDRLLDDLQFATEVVDIRQVVRQALHRDTSRQLATLEQPFQPVSLLMLASVRNGDL
jgi:hypothetical protein